MNAEEATALSDPIKSAREKQLAEEAQESFSQLSKEVDDLIKKECENGRQSLFLVKREVFDLVDRDKPRTNENWRLSELSYYQEALLLKDLREKGFIIKDNDSSRMIILWGNRE